MFHKMNKSVFSHMFLLRTLFPLEHLLVFPRDISVYVSTFVFQIAWSFQKPISYCTFSKLLSKYLYRRNKSDCTVGTAVRIRRPDQIEILREQIPAENAVRHSDKRALFDILLSQIGHFSVYFLTQTILAFLLCFSRKVLEFLWHQRFLFILCIGKRPNIFFYSGFFFTN